MWKLKLVLLGLVFIHMLISLWPDDSFTAISSFREHEDSTADSETVCTMTPVAIQALANQARMNTSIGKTQRRDCFVTIGATASFKPLLDATTTDDFFSTLKELGYTRFVLQCGPDLRHVTGKIGNASIDYLSKVYGIDVQVYDFNKRGLGQEMWGCKADGSRKEGIVICHAGAGTILDAMRIGVPIIVVPNPDLLDDHQAELAEELELQGYATYGRLK